MHIRIRRWVPLAIEDCIAESHLPKLDDYGDYLFMVVHGARRGDTPGTFDTIEVNFFVGKSFLVTFHGEHTRSIDHSKQRIQKNYLPMTRGIDFLLYEITDAMVDNYFPILDHFDEAIDELESEAFDNPTKTTLDRIFSLKRDVTGLRRIFGMSTTTSSGFQTYRNPIKTCPQDSWKLS